MGTYNPNCSECKAREEEDKALEEAEKKNRAENDRGFSDAIEGKECRATSPWYVTGYRHGRRTKKIGDSIRP